MIGKLNSNGKLTLKGVECVFMGAIGYNAPMIMFIHGLTTPLFSITPLITIKGAIKNIQTTYLQGAIMVASYRRNNTTG